MAKDYTVLARDIMELIGGTENVSGLTNCMTRLRFNVIDENKVKLDKLKQLDGVINVIISGGQHQVVIGTHVGKVYEAIESVTGVHYKGGETSSTSDKKSGNVLSAFLSMVSGIFFPAMGAMCGVGLLKGFLVALTTLGWMSNTSGVYTILYAASDAFFYFLPLILAYTAATKFNADKFVAVSIVGAMIYPTILTAATSGTAMNFAGIPVQLKNYTSTVIPAIMAVYVLSKLEKLLKKFIPELLKGILVPLICIVIMVPLALIVIGPAMNLVGDGIAAGYSFIYALSPAIAGMAMGILWPIMVIFGVHWGIVPIVMNNLSVLGYDTLLPVTIATNFAMAGGAFGVYLKTKNAKLKTIASPTIISALIGGITEPAIYGINLKFKKPFYIACGVGGVCGLLVGMAGAQYPALITICVLTLPAVAVFKGGVMMVIAAGIGFVVTTALTYFFGFNDSMIQE